MDTRVFLMIFYHGSLLWPWRGKYTHTNWYPPFVLLCGEQGWAIALLLFLGCPGCYFNSLPPSVTPGCCEPSPLLSSVAGAPGGKLAWPRGTQQCVSWVRGLALLFLRRWNTSGCQGVEGSRGEHTTLKLFVLFSFFRGWLNDQR